VKPDELRKGMENEALSVEDASWARETRRYLRWTEQGAVQFLSPLFGAFALAACWHVLRVVWGRYLWQMDQNPFGAWAASHPAGFDLVFLSLLIGVGLGLGWLRVRPLPGAAALALVPVWVWLIGALVRYDGIWREANGTVLDGATADFVAYPLTLNSLTFSAGCLLVGLFTILAGTRLRRRWSLP